MLVLGLEGTMLFLVELVLGRDGAGLGVDFAMFTSSLYLKMQQNMGFKVSMIMVKN